MTYLIIALTAIVSYLIGSVNFSILLSKMLSPAPVVRMIT